MAEGAVGWDLVRQAADGDAAARHRLVEDTVDALWSLALRLTRREDEADDVVQETYSRMFASIAGLKPTGRFGGYLARIATNLVIERWRRRRPTAPLQDPFLPPHAVEPWEDVADAEDERRCLAAVWAAAEGLPPQHRAAFLLFYAQGLPCEDIAGILDAPVGTIKTWLHRARREVRAGAEEILRGEAMLHHGRKEGAS